MYEFFIMSLVVLYAAALFVFFLVVIVFLCLFTGNTNLYQKYMRERRERLVKEFLKDVNK
jgi:Flp pilus assembly protein TadB